MVQHNTSDSLKYKLEKLQNDPNIRDRFELNSYRFGSDISVADSITFEEGVSNIGLALEKSSSLFASPNTSVVLFTDGNQTMGKDYEFSNLPQTNTVWPIVVGDTVTYKDLAVSQVNLNRYAFLDNQFPIETVVTYEGQEAIRAQLQVFFDGRNVHREQLQFQQGEKSKTLTTLLRATSIGIKSVEVRISTLTGERNTTNNKKEVAVDVIDEKTKVLLVSQLIHPDIGALKKAIESNDQRVVELVDPDIEFNEHADADVLLVYQPQANYQKAYDFAKSRRIPIFTVVGDQADLAWFNTNYGNLAEIELGYPTQEVFGEINTGFAYFDSSVFDFEGYPPLSTRAGSVSILAPQEVILDMTIKGIKMESPLLTVLSDANIKNVFLFGSDIWKWRLHDYRTHGNFEQFDNLFSKIMVYLSKSGKRNRLEVDYQKVYDGSQELKIRANFYDRTFVQDNQADLILQLRDKNTSLSRSLPMLLKGNYFEVDLTDLQPGEYEFTVNENNENISRQGAFKILDFDAENQIFTSNHGKLARLATKTKGEIFYQDQLDDFIDKLTQDNQFAPLQKNNQKIVPLIDFRLLLGLLALTLSAEWFIRKYNGLL